MSEAHVVVEFAAQTETANIWLKVRRHVMRLKIFGLLSYLAPLQTRLWHGRKRNGLFPVTPRSLKDDF